MRFTGPPSRCCGGRTETRGEGQGRERWLNALLSGFLLCSIGVAGLAGEAAAQSLDERQVHVTITVQEYARFVDLRPTSTALSFSERDILAGEQNEDGVAVIKPAALVFSYDSNNTMPIAVHIATPRGLTDPSSGAEIPPERLEWRLVGEEVWRPLGLQSQQVAVLRPGSIVALDLRLKVLPTDPVGGYGTIIVFTVMAVPENQGQN